ncbi:MAG: plasmid partition protein ParG [Microcystaceae cyanobacterium]
MATNNETSVKLPILKIGSKRSSLVFIARELRERFKGQCAFNETSINTVVSQLIEAYVRRKSGQDSDAP